MLMTCMRGWATYSCNDTCVSENRRRRRHITLLVSIARFQHPWDLQGRDAACQEPQLGFQQCQAAQLRGPRTSRAVAARAVSPQELEVQAPALRSAPPRSAATATQEGAAPEARDVAVALAKVAWDTKGEDVMVLEVAEQASWCRRVMLNFMLVSCWMHAPAECSRLQRKRCGSGAH
jgi:hypothetical protein